MGSNNFDSLVQFERLRQLEEADVVGERDRLEGVVVRVLHLRHQLPLLLRALLQLAVVLAGYNLEIRNQSTLTNETMQSSASCSTVELMIGLDRIGIG